MDEPRQQLELFNLALKVVPDYDGNVNSLFRFLKTANSIIQQYYDFNNAENFQNVIVINGILGKLHGKALEVIDVNSANTWERIREVLIENFCDQRDENALNRDLVNLHQMNESPQQFYDRCFNLLTTLINYINIHNDDETVIQCKRDFFTTQTLKTFLAGLREPLGSTIRSMRPQSLPEALQYIKEEANIMYLQKRNQSHQNSNQRPNNQGQSSKQNMQRLPPNWYQNRNNNAFFNPNQQVQPYYNRNPNFGQVRPNFNQQNKFNNFNQNPRIPQPRPTPMSGVSSANGVPNRPRFIPNPNYRPQPQFNQRPNYFQNVGHYPDYIFEELHHNETDYSDFDEQNNICQNYEPENYQSYIEPEFIPAPINEGLPSGCPQQTNAGSENPENFCQVTDQSPEM